MKGKSLTYRRRHNLGSSLYVGDLAARIIAKSGIPTDRFHLGKLVFQSLKESPDFVLQIDGALDKSETSGSALARSVRCATAMTNLGLKKGDVVVLLAPNHVDLIIPAFASMYLGVCVAGTDMTLGVPELEHSFKVNKPSIVFCQTDKAADADKALKGSGVNGHIVTFDEGSQYQTFAQFLDQYSDDKVTVDSFKPTDFDPEETVINLCATSGTTGLPKSAILTHKNLTISLTQLMSSYHKFPEPTRMYLLVSPSQWLSAAMIYITSALFKFTRLQTSAPPTRDHIYEIINKYKPTSFLSSPTLMMNLLEEGQRERCDFTCFEMFIIGGGFVPTKIFDILEVVAPNSEPELGYGMTEAGGVVMVSESEFPKGCVGKPSPHLHYKLVDPETLEEITEPNVPGELWLKGPSVFKGYYNNPEATKEALVDGWMRSGDLLRRDERNHYFFVERLKTLLKYRNHQISPIELEGVILRHPGVHDAVVVGVLEPETGGDLPAAFVVPKAGHKITAQEIKDIVKDNLADTKQLRGGVIFMKELPLTVTNKVDRQKLKKMAAEMERE